MSSATTIDLIRHGEPVGGRRYRGQSDDPLNERGWQQMQAAIGDSAPWNAVISSPLRRCADFARALGERHGLPVELDARWMELGFGEWEGRTAAEIMSADPDRLARFWADPERHAPPGGEVLADFYARVVAAWDDVVVRYARQHVLIVGHAGTIRMATTYVLGMPRTHLFRIEVPYAGITRVRLDPNGTGYLPRLIFHAGRL